MLSVESSSLASEFAGFYSKNITMESVWR